MQQRRIQTTPPRNRAPQTKPPQRGNEVPLPKTGVPEIDKRRWWNDYRGTTAYGCGCVSKRYLAGDAVLLATDAKACGDAPQLEITYRDGHVRRWECRPDNPTVWTEMKE